MSYSKHLPTGITTELTRYIYGSMIDCDYQRLMDEWGCVHLGLHQALFNEDYYIIGTHKAKQWLEDGVFEAQAMVKEWMMDNYGELTKDYAEIVTDPERLANMVAYIIGEELINNMEDDEFHTMTNYPEDEAC